MHLSICHFCLGLCAVACLLGSADDAFAQLVTPPTVTPLGDTGVNATSSGTPKSDLDQCFGAVREEQTVICSGGLFGSYAFTNAARTTAYFGDVRVGGTVALSIGDNQTALYTELISSNANLSKLGYARVGFGALVSADQDPDSTATTAEQFFQGGGNAALYAALPLAYRFVVNRETSGDDPRLVRRYDLMGVLTLGADLPALNAAADEFALVGQLGPQFQIVQNATDDAIRFFVRGGAGVSLAHDDFFGNIRVSEGDRPAGNFFASANVTVGVDLNDLIRVGASSGTSTLGGLNRPWQFTVQLIPQQTKSTR